ncbi:class I SAM-dependent methyltransferase [Streptomyces sp. SLBN-8D4]|jgi:SAM-dependent methyltransferase|uniref:class I SAM-dependent methyltransferase n=1 Tax=Streptomyces sp. SLBN-8D4 TaxID=3377728 RepID=UPI003C7D03EF
MSAVERPLFTREDRYRSVLANQGRGSTLQSIYRDIYGADYPGEVEPFGFVTLSDLRLLTQILAESHTTRLLDVGCGRGGPGLWIARELGVPLIGVDIIAEAVAAASDRAAGFGMASSARFYVASATDTGLPAGGFDGAVSIDALWMVHDKAAAFRELARVLRPAGRLVFTSWEPARLPYDSFLERAGFTDITKQEIAGSRDREIAVHKAILRHGEAICLELGKEAAEVLMAEATHTPALLDGTPRVIISALRGR